MVLKTLLTALTCLCSTTNIQKCFIPIILTNSVERNLVGNGTGCAVFDVYSLITRIQSMSNQLKLITTDIQELKYFINKYDTDSQPPQLESRIFSVGSVFPYEMISNSDENGTPRNCLNQKHGQVRIRIKPDEDAFYVNCDQKLRDGGWLVIAYRFDGSEDFNRKWHMYKSGFGALNGEFFIGLDKLHTLTNSGDHELLIIMRNQTMEERFALYDQFSIGSEAENYFLYVLGTYRGDAGDSLRYHAGKKFTTLDKDNDDNGQNCARTHNGAWWYGRDCFESNLFGTFQTKYGQEIGFYKGILWKTFLPGPTGSLRYVRMMIRPHQKQ